MCLMQLPARRALQDSWRFPSSDRLVDRFGERGEELRPAGSHVPAILQADAELTGNVDPRLVGEAHARGQRCRVVAHEEGRLMAIHADAVSGPVRKPWQAVILAPAALLVEVPYRLVDRADRLAER